MFPAGLQSGKRDPHTCAALPTPARRNGRSHGRVAREPSPGGIWGPGRGGPTPPGSRETAGADAPTAHPDASGERVELEVPPHPTRASAPEPRSRRPRAQAGVLVPFQNSPGAWSGEFVTTGGIGSPDTFVLEAPRPRSPRISPGAPSPGKADSQRGLSPSTPELPSWEEEASGGGQAGSRPEGCSCGAEASGKGLAAGGVAPASFPRAWLGPRVWEAARVH